MSNNRELSPLNSQSTNGSYQLRCDLTDEERYIIYSNNEFPLAVKVMFWYRHHILEVDEFRKAKSPVWEKNRSGDIIFDLTKKENRPSFLENYSFESMKEFYFYLGFWDEHFLRNGLVTVKRCEPEYGGDTGGLGLYVQEDDLKFNPRFVLLKKYVYGLVIPLSDILWNKLSHTSSVYRTHEDIQTNKGNLLIGNLMFANYPNLYEPHFYLNHKESDESTNNIGCLPLYDGLEWNINRTQDVTLLHLEPGYLKVGLISWNAKLVMHRIPAGSQILVDSLYNYSILPMRYNNRLYLYIILSLFVLYNFNQFIRNYNNWTREGCRLPKMKPLINSSPPSTDFSDTSKMVSQKNKRKKSTILSPYKSPSNTKEKKKSNKRKQSKQSSSSTRAKSNISKQRGSHKLSP